MSAGTTVLVVTHNKDIVNTMKKRVVTMDEGVIVSGRERREDIMRPSTIWFTLKQGIVNIKRNWMFFAGRRSWTMAALHLSGRSVLFPSLIMWTISLIR